MKISAHKPLLSTLKPAATAPGQEVFLPAAAGVAYQKVEAPGTPLCQSQEQGLGGECATALVHREVGRDAQGRGFLKA